MPNQLFQMVTQELEPHLGDILSVGITKKGLRSLGYCEDDVTPEEMVDALRRHIQPAMLSFMGGQKAAQIVRNLELKISGGNGK